MEFIFLKQFEFFYNQIITVYTYTFIVNTFPITICHQQKQNPTNNINPMTSGQYW